MLFQYLTITRKGLKLFPFKKVFTYSLFSASVIFIACQGQNNANITIDKTKEQTNPSRTDSIVTGTEGIASTNLGKNIQCIFQDKNDNYWFGTQKEGVYRYNGRTILQFTDKDGLSNNQVQTIQEDASGNIWFGTGGFGISRFDGKTMTTFTTLENLRANTYSDNKTAAASDDLWFYAGDGMYRHDENGFTHLPLQETTLGSTNSQSPSNRLSPYAVYCSLKDAKGNFWFGTQSMGVCRYDPSEASGNSLKWFTASGLAGPAVLALFEDKNGILWFGNNGSGLFRYDPVTDVLTNFTQEKGLSNDEFRKTGKSGPGTLARIYTINEDTNGNLWIGTADAGAWRYDGKQLKNYTTKDGLTSDAVSTIYKDKKGELWFGTETAICKFNGTSITSFIPH